jgi:sulfate adenylyltransferase
MSSLVSLGGLTVFLTGLPGAGKSTIALALRARLLETDRCVALFDGDVLRKHISPSLGFSKRDRDLHVLRAGLLAVGFSKNQGIAICALIAPYDHARKQVRALVEAAGCRFMLVHVATPLNVCEARDSKGLYARARRGDLCQFTGLTDPYEPPADADLVLDATHLTPQEAAKKITDRHPWQTGTACLG